jgi:hypothetical protein
MKTDDNIYLKSIVSTGGMIKLGSNKKYLVGLAP